VELPYTPEAIKSHKAGKKHVKLAIDANDDSVLCWLSQTQWAALQATAAVGSKATATPGGEAPVAAATGKSAAGSEAAGGKRTHAVDDALSLSGRAAVVHSQAGIDHNDNDHGQWETAGGSGGGGGRKGAAGPSSGAGTGSGDMVVQSRLVHMEGGINILSGLAVAPNFLTKPMETALLRHVEEALMAGQARRLRGATFVPTRSGVAAQLHYGTFQEITAIAPAAGGRGGGGDDEAPTAAMAVPSQKAVEPLPPAVSAAATRIMQKADALGIKTAIPANSWCATVFILEPGMHLPPLATLFPRALYRRPVCVLVCAGDEDVLFGLGIQPVRGPGADTEGEFDAAFALRVARRTLLVLDHTAADVTGWCVGRVARRTVVVALRCMAPHLLAAMMARGNAL
jgi:hypothetical protein